MEEKLVTDAVELRNSPTPGKSTNLYTSLQRAVCSLCQMCTLPVIHR